MLVLIAVSAIVAGLLIYAAICYFTVTACPGCYKPLDRCECHLNCTNPKGHAFWSWRWSQDGWVRKCKFCGNIEYGGDDYDGGPSDDGHMVSDR